jgi:hypothetical protein
MTLFDESAEQAFLCSAMWGIQGGQEATRLTPQDFWNRQHGVLLQAIQALAHRGVVAEVLTLRGELLAKGKLNTPTGVPETLLFHISGLTVSSGSAGYYADQLRTLTRLREFHIATERAQSRTTTTTAIDDLPEIERLLRADLADLPRPLDVGQVADDTLATILKETDIDTDWLTPGWLARGERAVVVAGEGVAKTTLMRQFAVCMAGGLNPWNRQRVSDGRRVLFIDAENSRNQTRKAYRWIASRCYRSTMAPGWADRIVHRTRNDGVDLVQRDNAWFRDVVDQVQPDALILGPAYKLMRGDPQKDRDVQDLLDAVDQVRVAHDCATLIETHAPHGQFQGRVMRPYGSSVWLRWPEVGIGYQRDETAEEEAAAAGATVPERPQWLQASYWRGSREPRDWPTHLQQGSVRDLPWVPNDFRSNEPWAPSVDVGYEIPPGEVA